MSAPKTKLFVGHLPDGCTNDDLYNLFSKYGNVKECDVINKYGFVHMSTPEEAQDALKALNNYYFRGSSLSVEPSKSKLHPEPGSQGRARGGSSRGRGFGGPRGGGYANGYGRRYDGPPFGGRDYYDRGYSSMSARMRPYPSPYDRPSPAMGPMRDDYADPYSSSLRDPYSSRTGMSPMSRDLYERRATTYPSASDYLYSRRSPTSMDVGRSYWYNDSLGDSRRTYGELLGEDPYVDGYTRKYDGSSYREQDFYDRSDSSLPTARRPYSSLYDRSNSSAAPMRDDYVDPYSSRSSMPSSMSRSLYERKATAYLSDGDDLYSRRPAAPSMDLGRMRMSSSAGARPYF